MTSNVLELLVSGVIIIGIIVMIWRGGAANPVSTGGLERRIGEHTRRLGSVEEQLKGCATSAALGLLATEMRSLEERAASSGEVLALEGKMVAFDARVDGRLAALEMQFSGKVDRIDAQLAALTKAADRDGATLERIEGYFIQRGINGQ